MIKKTNHQKKSMAVQFYSGTVGIKKLDDDPDADSCIMHITIHKDNSGALILATTLPPKFTPCSKHYAIKTIWFHNKIIEYEIKRSSLSRQVFNWATSLLKCPLKSPLSSFASYLGGGDNHCLRGNVK